MKFKVIITGLILILILSLGINYSYKDDLQESYDKGYAQGFYNSDFIDCSLPSMNETTEIIFYDDESSGNIKHLYLNKLELCGRLEVNGYYKKIDSNEAYNLTYDIFKKLFNPNESSELIKKVLKDNMKENEKGNYLMLFDDSRTKHLEASESGGKK